MGVYENAITVQPRNEHEVVLIYGWPESGGVWLLKTTNSKAGEVGIGRVGNVVSMKERCDVLQRLGAQFYADRKDCPDLKL